MALAGMASLFAEKASKHPPTKNPARELAGFSFHRNLAVT